MKKHGTTILLILIFVAGVCLLLYPTVSNYWNSYHQSKAISSYSESVANLDDGKQAEMMAAAKKHNEDLFNSRRDPRLTDDQMAKYNATLNVTGTGIMGYIEIPTIDVSLPVYHGTSDAVLQVAVGHIEWSSLPVGGINTHCVVSGHRGLPSAKLFTNLDKLVEGDLFFIHILGDMITYEVDRILIVEPQEVASLGVVAGEDLCTLVTCTPYGINSHRLLVRGHRVANPEEAPKYNIIAEATQIKPLIIAPIIAMPMLLILLLFVMIKYRKKK